LRSLRYFACGVPGCCKAFEHQHVGSERQGVEGGAVLKELGDAVEGGMNLKV
jgi:hypothetical protein